MGGPDSRRSSLRHRHDPRRRRRRRTGLRDGAEQRMKRLWAAAAVSILALAGCGDGASEAPQTSSPSATQETSDAPAKEDGPPIALDSVCDLLLEQSAMPHDD